jgi:PKD repeat protein
VDGLTWSPWSEPLTGTGAAVSSPSGRYFQYRAELSTRDTLLSPKIEQVSVQYFGPNTLMVTPSTAILNPLATQPFSAQIYDSNNQPIQGLSYTWQVVNGGGTIDNTGLFTAAISAGTYTNTVQATSAGVTGTATVMINNLPPQAAAGGPYGPISETFSLELNGTASTDPNDDALSYAWDLDNDGFYNDAFTHTVAYVWNEPGLYQVGLIVTDSHGLTDTTTGNVNVTNLLPTAVISGPFAAEGGEMVTFDGSASSDPGGGSLQFSWDFDNDGFFDDGVGAVLAYRFKLAGSYEVHLRVSDNQGGQAVETFTIQINSNAEDAYGVYLPIVRK